MRSLVSLLGALRKQMHRQRGVVEMIGNLLLESDRGAMKVAATTVAEMIEEMTADLIEEMIAEMTVEGIGGRTAELTGVKSVRIDVEIGAGNGAETNAETIEDGVTRIALRKQSHCPRMIQVSLGLS